MAKSQPHLRANLPGPQRVGCVPARGAGWKYFGWPPVWAGPPPLRGRPPGRAGNQNRNTCVCTFLTVGRIKPPRVAPVGVRGEAWACLGLQTYPEPCFLRTIIPPAAATRRRIGRPRPRVGVPPILSPRLTWTRPRRPPRDTCTSSKTAPTRKRRTPHQRWPTLSAR